VAGAPKIAHLASFEIGHVADDAIWPL